MDAIQRSEFNNQTNNGANEKWTPGAKGKTKDDGQPLDHTYPQGLGVQQQGNQQQGGPENTGTQQTGAGPGAADGQFERSDAQGSTVPGGNMQSQISGGSGPVQGITDSHQRQMEQKSGAYGLLEQPVGHRPKDSGTNLNEMRDRSASTQGGGMYGPDTRVAPSAALGSMGNRQYVSQGNASTGAGGGAPGSGHGDGQEAQRGNTQLGVAGSNMGSNQHSDAGGVHQSNDVAGGLPRSPGNAGADHAASYDRTGSQTGPAGDEGDETLHQSNDAAGGYPRSPGRANRLSGSDNMDDDTGFKRKP